MSRRTRTQRSFDVAVAIALLAITLPVWPVVYVAIRLDSTGPAIFRGRRMGRDAQEFTILKFRSMTHTTSEVGPGVTVGGDARVTRIGRLLRITKLDELPQLVNVLRGEMSIVGWRPEDPRYLPHYSEEMREIFVFSPGITSPASIEFRHEESILANQDGHPETVYVTQILPAKVAVDIDYCRRATLWSDLGVVARTIGSIVRRHA